MRKLLNVLYVTTPEAYLSRDGENVVVRVGDEERLRTPAHILEGIVCFGHVGASPALMNLCAERGIGLSFHTETGRFLARVSGPMSGNVLLRRQQYRLSDDPTASASMAKWFVMGKIANCRSVIMRALRDHREAVDAGSLQMAGDELSACLERLERANTVDAIRGIEGDAARTYFANFNHLLLTQKEDFSVSGRNRRPPLDNMNALLSFLYTLLQHDVQSACEAVGLDPAVGYLHRDRPGRPSLALDLMEELRPYLVDRLALSLVNLRQVTAQGFTVRENGGVFMDDDTRKTVIAAWQKRKFGEIRHPYLDEKIPVGLLPFAQSLLLSRYMRGDIDGYPPFFWR